MEFSERIPNSPGLYPPHSVAGAEFSITPAPSATAVVYATPSGAMLSNAAKRDLLRRSAQAAGLAIVLEALFPNVNLWDLTSAFLNTSIGQVNLTTTWKVTAELFEDNSIVIGTSPLVSVSNPEAQRRTACCHVIRYGLDVLGVTSVSALDDHAVVGT